MISLYLIDYENNHKNNGLSTYVYQLGDIFREHTEIDLNYIWLNSQNTEILNRTINNAKHINIPKSLNKYNKRISNFELSKIIAKQIRNKENVIVHFNWINHLPIAWYLKKKVDCKIVLTKHCIPWKDFITNNYPLFKTLNRAYENGKAICLPHPSLKRENLGYDFIDHIITVTQCAKKSLKRLFNVPDKKISVVYNGIAPIQISFLSKVGLRKKYGFPENEKIILFAGKVNERKGAKDLLRMFAQLLTDNKVNARLIIAGEGSHSKMLEYCGNWWGKITFTGNLDKDILQEFYALSDIGVVPSYVEQCSYSALEMMCNGLPIVVSDVDGLSEIVPDGCGLKIKIAFEEEGLFFDFDAWKEKLLFLLKNENEAARLSNNAKNHVLENHNAKKMASETIEIYKKLLSTKENPKKRIHKIKSRYNPKISVMLPCYNGEEFLKECIDSILNQDYKNFELIFVNDASTDSSKEIINNYSDSRIKYIENNQNKGIAFSLNKGIEESIGKYIARMDCDDVMHPNRLHKQVAFLEKNKEYGIVGTSYTIINKFSLPIDYREPALNHEDICLSMLFYNPIVHPSVMMRKEIALSYKYDESQDKCEDYSLWMKASRVTKIKNLKERLLSYRIHENNTSGHNIKTRKLNCLNLQSQELNRLGIQHTSCELMIHAAISSGSSHHFFNTKDKISELEKWLDKVLHSKKISEKYSEPKRIEFKTYILNNLLGNRMFA